MFGWHEEPRGFWLSKQSRILPRKTLDRHQGSQFSADYLDGIWAAPEAGATGAAGTASAALPEAGMTAAGVSRTLPELAGRELPK